MTFRIKALIATALFCSLPVISQTPRRVLVVSIDGLDQRYLAEADRRGLRIPNIRKLMREGQWADGVVGVVPTVTWPSHTTMISGVDPSVHGIEGNRRPRAEGGEYYWNVSLLKAKTLIDAMKTAGRSAAAITWPVTVDAPLTYNLPEYFERRQGGSMDLRSIESKSAPPDLVQKIAEMYPTFAQQWMDDRTRTLATLYLLKTAHPDLILVHLVNLDAEAHDTGPFTREANATLEHIDQLVGDMLRALPSEYNFVLVSDHGFEKVDEVVNLAMVAKARGVDGVRVRPTMAVADSPAAADLIRKLRTEGKFGVGREIPKDEIIRFAPNLAKAAAVVEPAPGYEFTDSGAERAKPRELGNHGFWPTRYRSVYIAWGPGVQARRLPEISQKDIAGRLAELLGVSFKPGAK